MFYKIAQLSISPGKKSGGLDEVFVAQPDSARERLAGQLFAIIRIESREAAYAKLLDYLLPELNHQYYQNEKMILRERLSTIKIDHIFESALSKTNKSIASLIQNEKLAIDPSLLSATLGVIYENELHFTTFGRNRAFLIAAQPAAGGEKRYKTTEVAGNEPAQAQMNLNKLFTTVVSGRIPPAGYFLFTDETLPEYLSEKQLQEVITSLPPAGALEQIKNLLEKINLFVPFSAILIKNTTGLMAVEPPRPSAQNVQSSISNLKTTESSTEKLLAPSGIIDLRGWTDRLLSLVRPKKSKGLSAVDKELLIDKVFFKKRPNFNYLKKLSASAKNGLFYLSGIFLALARLFGRPQKILDALSRFFSSLRQNAVDSARLIAGLGLKMKIILGLALLSLLLFAVNSVFTNQRNRVVATRQAGEDNLKTIERRADQIEADLLYNNESGAKAELTEIRRLMDQLPPEIRGGERAAAAEKRINDFALRLRHLIKLNGRELFDFSAASPASAPANLAFSGDSFFAADKERPVVYYYNPARKTGSSTALAAGAPLFSPSVAGGQIIYLYPGGAAVFDTKKMSGTASALKLPAGRVAAGAIYNNRLYAALPEAGQIFRFNREGAGFGAGSAWLAEKSDLTGAAGMFIDGNLYLSYQNGRAARFLKGKKQDFGLSEVEPPLTGAAKIIVTQKSQFLYLLEPGAGRLVIFNKLGKFIKQYELSGGGDLKDVALDEKAKKIYWLSGSKVFETPASEL